MTIDLIFNICAWCVGGVVAGVVSDRTGASALTCLVMLAFAAPFVSSFLCLNISLII